MWKSNLEESKRRYLDWWNHKGIVLTMWEHIDKEGRPHAEVPRPTPARDMDQFWFDPRWRAEYLRWKLSHSSFMADILPVANTQLGPGSLGAILGGELQAREDTIWILEDKNFDGNIHFDPDNRWWKLHQDLLKECRKAAGNDYFVGCPDLMEGLDVLASLRGSDKVLMDMVLEPEKTAAQLQTINDAYFEVFDRIYDIINVDGEMAFCYFSIWGQGKVSKLQSDISIMISPEDFRTFVQPYIRQQTQRLDYSLYHLDGVGAIRHLDALLEIEKLNAIQWTSGVGQPQGGDPRWFDLYRRILAAGKSVMANWVQLEQIEPLIDAVGPDGLHINVDFHNEKEIEQALTIIQKYE